MIFKLFDCVAAKVQFHLYIARTRLADSFSGRSSDYLMLYPLNHRYASVPSCTHQLLITVNCYGLREMYNIIIKYLILRRNEIII